MVTEVLARSQAPQNGYHTVSPNKLKRRSFAYRLVITDTVVVTRAVLAAAHVSTVMTPTVRPVVAQDGAV